MAAALLLFFIFYLAVIIFFIGAYWKIFVKAGKPGWACIIPIYSAIVLLEIIKKPTWWLFMFFIPFVNIYYAVVATNELSKAFGKDTGFTVGLILLPFIFYPILGYGSAEYLLDKDNELNEIGLTQE
ncbi:DUF5684 domain-containing protein [Flavobacterium sp. U410]|jgi:hypothetical protein